MFRTDLVSADLKKTFKDKGRVHIPDALTQKNADNIFGALTRNIPWGINYTEENEAKTIPRDRAMSMTERRTREVTARILQQAVKGDFQYAYFSCPMTANGLGTLPDDHFIHRLAAFIASDTFIDPIRLITGLKSLSVLEAEATSFKAHGFVMPRRFDDGRIGFSLSFTKNWRPDFGGYLEFIDEWDNITEAYAPHFNSLSLFRTSQKHAIGYVTPYAPYVRLAVSGWLGKK